LDDEHEVLDDLSDRCSCQHLDHTWHGFFPIDALVGEAGHRPDVVSQQDSLLARCPLEHSRIAPVSAASITVRESRLGTRRIMARRMW
jgi:hypothetical protein